MSIYNEILNLLKSTADLLKYMQDISAPIQFTFKECLQVIDLNLIVDDSHILKINVILDYLHDKLNTGHWRDVPVIFRQFFTVLNFVHALIILKIDENIDNLKKALKAIDFGLLLGAPLTENNELLLKAASILTQKINLIDDNTLKNNENIKKRKLTNLDIINEYINIKAKEINSLSCPSIELFNNKHFLPQIPIILKDCINHWPAMEKWLNVNYLISVAGDRTVPIEIGSHYVDENWSQKLMTLKDFIKNYFLCEKLDDNLGYLAQHNLFDQIAELRNDISIPDYCCLSKNDEEPCDPDINAWFGPKNTVSPLHYDPKNNLLTQIFGTKQIILFSPEDSKYLYPHEDKLLENTSQINPLNVNFELHPLVKNACMYKCLLQPGEMLFIPEKWWHHVKSLEKSFSVSFWWK